MSLYKSIKWVSTLMNRIIVKAGFTRLSSETVRRNRGLPEVMQFGMHLFGNCHPSERTERKANVSNEISMTKKFSVWNEHKSTEALTFVGSPLGSG